MSGKSKKIFWFFSILGGILLLAVLVMLFLIFSKKKAYDELQIKLIQENRKIKDVESLRNIVYETADGRKFVDGLFVNKDNIIDFIEFIESLNEMSGAEVKVVSVGDDAGQTGLHSSIRFEAEGTWQQVFKVLSLVDHIPVPIDVSGAQLSKISEDKKNPVWQAQIEARVLKF